MESGDRQRSVYVCVCVKQREGERERGKGDRGRTEPEFNSEMCLVKLACSLLSFQTTAVPVSHPATTTLPGSFQHYW